MCELTVKQILPASIEFSTRLADNIQKLAALKIDARAQRETLDTVAALIGDAYAAEQKLSEAQLAIKNETDLQSAANFCHDTVFAAMQELRTYCDRLETLVSKDLWPFPSYGDLLLYV